MSNNNNNNNPNNNRSRRSIRGPQSALTHFLASHNISASSIRETARQRRAAADAAAAAAATSADNPDAVDDEEEEEEAGPSAASAASSAREQKRKRQSAAIEKIKKSKAKKRKRQNGDDSDSDDLADALLQGQSAPAPGQQANCDACNKRFTVTPYSRAGPNGGLLCGPCGKELAKDEADSRRQKKKAKPGPKPGSRRNQQSRMLDGSYTHGAKSLLTLCVETLAKNIHLADDLGDLPPYVINRISRELSKRRLFGTASLQLLLQAHAEEIKIYDAGLLGSDDFIRVFATMAKLKALMLRNAIQFKDHVMEYLIGRQINLESLYLHGANLVTEDCWKEYLKVKGSYLKELRVYFTDRHFTDDIVSELKTHCTSLTKLKICHNQEVSDEGIKTVAELPNLKYLGLDHLKKHTTTGAYIHVIEKIGSQLEAFSVQHGPDLDDSLLDALHDNCNSLKKLRVTGSELLTDAGFARLFKDWKNPPLSFLNVSSNRHVDSEKPQENEQDVGLCSDGFRALMNHSGRRLESLSIFACRHISREAFEEVFALGSEYPNMKNLEISFCNVTDLIVGCIFRACPNLRKMSVFGCMKLRKVRVPRGKILVGMPNALGTEIEGQDD
ncbi:hypothetical protein F4778DRAFT_730483 [Xylariomycetidae sp. FL2044]|nr:hypothetical protein F4778DRAFT_730483 [Xylariomycetidae sp. FL2044]